MDVEESSGTTTTTGTGSRRANKKNCSKVDRSRTLISERRRRGRMKEKLYALRSLVPTITKMDKASIVGDAVLYVRDLQMQVKKLKSEISSLGGGVQSTCQGRSDGSINGKNNMSFFPVIKKIFKMDVFEVEERGFYVRIVCNKGRGIAALLYKALESLTTFTLPTSNLAASADNYVLTFTLHIMEGEMDINLQNMELWIASVFLKQGFELETSQQPV
ncbi:UNVERIFIED_CONTAM: Transcription factor FER-LIKE IRON DEFICIENCY-INDUCED TRANSCRIPTION FACTOR [Sesamum calycinum]|uniref:Transcription factor FER-LIKE IRON DEFICIENCY-INDUCED TRANSCRIPTION FACTOR n=1 Tax=Sesamum calycinum TaxID=2727403 RepID=A0AAW2SCC7_9LAMI